MAFSFASSSSRRISWMWGFVWEKKDGGKKVVVTFIAIATFVGLWRTFFTVP